MLFKRRKIILVLSIIFCMLLSSIPVYAIETASSGSTQRFHSHGGGSGGAPQPGSVVHVYFDDGPKDPASGSKPAQGYMTRDGQWHKGSSNKSTYDFFIDLLDAKLEARYNKSLVARKNKTFNGNSAYPEYKKILDQAAQKALNRNPDAQYARIVGVALTYRLNPEQNGWNIADSMSGTPHATSWDRLWSNKPTELIPDYPNKSEFTYKTDEGELKWFQKVAPDNATYGAYANKADNYAQALYMRSKAESDQGDHTGMYIVIYAIAVTEFEPDNPTPVRFHKHSDNMSITDGNAQYSVANCEFTITGKKDGKLIGTLTTNADGYTDYIDLYPGEYKVVETVSPPGYAGYSITHYIKVGEETGDSVEEDEEAPPTQDPGYVYTPYEDTSSDEKVNIVFDESKNPRQLDIAINEDAWDDNWWLMEVTVDNNNNYTLVKNTKLTDKNTSATLSNNCHVFVIVNSVDEPTVDIQDGISYALDTRIVEEESDTDN